MSLTSVLYALFSFNDLMLLTAEEKISSTSFSVISIISTVLSSKLLNNKAKPKTFFCSTSGETNNFNLFTLSFSVQSKTSNSLL